MGICNCSMFCCVFLCVYSSFAIILMRKRGLFALLVFLVSRRPHDATDFSWYFLIILTISIYVTGAILTSNYCCLTVSVRLLQKGDTTAYASFHVYLHVLYIAQRSLVIMNQ